MNIASMLRDVGVPVHCDTNMDLIDPNRIVLVLGEESWSQTDDSPWLVRLVCDQTEDRLHCRLCTDLGVVAQADYDDLTHTSLYQDFTFTESGNERSIEQTFREMLYAIALYWEETGGEWEDRPAKMVDAIVNGVMESGQTELSWAEGYAGERDGDDPGNGRGIWFADWNRPSLHNPSKYNMAVLFKWLEGLGCACEWSDEWTRCDECCKAFRTSPDGYAWTMFGWMGDGGYVCGACTVDDPEGVGYLEHINERGASIPLDWEELGYVKLNDERLETGYHPGQNDDPAAVIKTLQEVGIEHFHFVLDSQGQFDTKFSVWVHSDEDVDRAIQAFTEGKTKYALGQSPAEIAERGLRAASKLPSPEGTGGVVVTKIHGDGGATSRRVSEQDFIDGKALDP